MAEESKAESIAKEVKAEVAADGVKGEATGVAVKAESANTVTTVRELFSLPEKETDPADEKLEPIKLPFSIPITGGEVATAATEQAALSAKEKRPVSPPEVERIEL